MAQQPSLAAASLTTERDSVTRELFGVPFTSVLSAQQTQITTEGNAAFYEVTQWARWYTEISPDTTDLPSEWNEAFRQLWVAKCKRLFRSPQDYHAHFQTYVGPLLQRIANHFTGDWNSSSALADDTVTVQSIRRTVIALCVRQRTPIFPVILQLDTMIREEFVKLWNSRKWEFRKRDVDLTINADGTLTLPANHGFDGMASKSFAIATSTNMVQEVKWLDATRFSIMRTRMGDSEGIPKFFYDTDHGQTKAIRFLPAPDAAYTGHAVIYITAPAFGDAMSTNGLNNLPAEFRAHLRDLVFAKCLGIWGREDNDAARAYNRTMSEQNRLAAEWDDKGASRSTARPHGQKSWINQLMSGGGLVIGGRG